MPATFVHAHDGSVAEKMDDCAPGPQTTRSQNLGEPSFSLLNTFIRLPSAQPVCRRSDKNGFTVTMVDVEAAKKNDGMVSVPKAKVRLPTPLHAHPRPARSTPFDFFVPRRCVVGKKKAARSALIAAHSAAEWASSASVACAMPFRTPYTRRRHIHDRRTRRLSPSKRESWGWGGKPSIDTADASLTTPVVGTLWIFQNT